MDKKMDKTIETQIQQWVILDNQCKLLQEKTKELREKKSSLLESITSNGGLSTNSVVNITDGRLKLVNTNTTTPLTFTYVETCLSEIIKNEEQVKKIVDYLKKRRETKTVTELKRYYNNIKSEK
jgi:vacuolar-type H+-ATPase subunit H